MEQKTVRLYTIKSGRRILMEPYGALIRLKTAGQGEADRLIEHRKMNLSLNKTGRKTGMEEMKDEFMSEKELEDHVENR